MEQLKTQTINCCGKTFNVNHFAKNTNNTVLIGIVKHTATPNVITFGDFEYYAKERLNVYNSKLDVFKGIINDTTFEECCENHSGLQVGNLCDTPTKAFHVVAVIYYRNDIRAFSQQDENFKILDEDGEIPYVDTTHLINYSNI